MLPKRILVVEDQPAVAMATRADLEELGYEALGIAKSVDEALLAVGGATTDVVLPDSQLNGEGPIL